MPIEQFKQTLIERLRQDIIPKSISNEKEFELSFVKKIAYAVCKTEKDIYLYSHPWAEKGKEKAHCVPDCESAHAGKGHIQEGCDKCWYQSKKWGTVNVFGTKNNFDLVAIDTCNRKLVVEIKYVSFKNNRKPNGEIQRFLGQCAMAASKFDFVVGMCGYNGVINPDYDLDTRQFMKWSENNNINIIFRSASE